MALQHGHKWESMPDKEKVAHLDELCDSQNKALKMMQDERNALLLVVKRLEVDVKNAESAVYSQKTIVRQLIDEKVENDTGYEKRIQELMDEVRASGGNIH